MSTSPSSSKSNTTENSAKAAHDFWVDREPQAYDCSSEVEDKPPKKFKLDRVIVSRKYIDDSAQKVTKATIDRLQNNPFKLSDESDNEDDDNDDDDSSGPYMADHIEYAKACSSISTERREELKREMMDEMREYIKDLTKFDAMHRDFDKKFEPRGELRVLNVVILN